MHKATGVLQQMGKALVSYNTLETWPRSAVCTCTGALGMLEAEANAARGATAQLCAMQQAIEEAREAADSTVAAAQVGCCCMEPLSLCPCYIVGCWSLSASALFGPFFPIIEARLAQAQPVL